MRCDRNQSISARMSRLNPPNSRVSLDTAPPSPLINTVDVLHPVHVDPGNTLMDRFHNGSPSVMLNLREAPGGPARDALCRVRDTGQFTVRAARFACATIRGADLAGWIRLAVGILIAKLRATSYPKPPAPHSSAAARLEQLSSFGASAA